MSVKLFLFLFCATCYPSFMPHTPETRRAYPTLCGDPVTGGTFVQSLLFDRDLWTEEEARAWALAHGFIASAVDKTANKIRLRQIDPAACEYRTKPFGESSGIQAVIETPSPRTSSPSPRTSSPSPRTSSPSPRVLALMHEDIARRVRCR